ncbi:penicillin-binding protein [Pseudonocardia sp. KRD-169]|uniref:Penicillin-binding protein n=1 Tax=Pseudonocardia abyssalis TaxID=2792008 RepID=A0ABS6UQL4_9PSEU|nr:penicillin-binding protein [Pseudonocardia abyssalis]MBW0134505.1 penicillin-binding protein [Pseudonocardia abyssalis]
MRRAGAGTRLVGLVMAGGLVAALMSLPLVGGLGLVAERASGSATELSPELRSGIVPEASTVTDSTGAPIAYLYDQFRIPSGSVSAAMRAAIVAIEDRRFFDHGGVDPIGTLRAFVHDASGGAQQGGSTLTQQYVKNYELYVTATTDAQRAAAVAPSVARKVTEAELAVQLDHALSKDEILARYLDLVYFGHGAYGVGAAARAYFGTTPDRLSVAQSALLAGLVQSPAQDDPVAHPAAALARRGLVLDAMHGQGAIDDAQYATAAAEPLGVGDVGVPRAGCSAAGDAGYFCAYVSSYLQAAGLSPEQLAGGGYTVRTTLDRSALDHLVTSLTAQAPPGTSHVADVMSVVAPGADRHPVVAIAANRPFGNGEGESAYDLPVVPENLGAGSVYKIFTAAAALDQGIAGIDTVLDVPAGGSTLPNYRGADGRPSPVRNAGTYPSRLSLTDALAQSPNTAFVELEGRTGVAPAVDMAQRLGLTSLDTPGPDGRSTADVAREEDQASFTLGVSPTSDLELANVMATIASHGTWCPPTPITSVTDRDGDAVALTEPPCTQAVDPGLADTLMVGLSRDAAPGGTSASAAASSGWDRPIAAKTGTTQDQESAAFVGATPQLAGAVITFDDSASPRPICDGSPPRSCASGTLFGGTVPARTFYRAMGPILAGQPVADLPDPDPRYLDAR